MIVTSIVHKSDDDQRSWRVSPAAGIPLLNAPAQHQSSSAGVRAAMAESSLFPRSSEDDPLYFDYNATTPVDPEVAAEMVKVFSVWGNPSSSHVYGQRAKAVITLARERVAALVHAKPKEITFTSGGTECINWCLKGVVQAARKVNRTDDADWWPHVISSRVEHPAVLHTLEYLEKEEGVRVTLLGVNHEGCVSAEDVVAAVVPGHTVLVSLMQGNNEVGTLTPWRDIVDAVHKAHPEEAIKFHSDSSQCTSKVPVHLDDLGVDYATIAGHKMYGPKGVGALYIREGTKPALAPMLLGGGQEGGRRCGTENTILIAGLGKASELASFELDSAMSRYHELRTLLLEELTKRCDVKPVPNGTEDPARRLPQTLSVGFPGATVPSILQSIRRHVSCSAAAACHSSETEEIMSHVLHEMGVDRAVGISTLRLSVGKYTTKDDVCFAAHVISQAVNGELAGLAVPDIKLTLDVSGGPTVTASGAGNSAAADATEALYMRDTYLWEAKGTVVSAQQLPEDLRVSGYPQAVIVDRSVFHPQGGGQPADRGYMLWRRADGSVPEEAKIPADDVDTASLQSPTTVVADGDVVFAVGLVKKGVAGEFPEVMVHYGEFVSVEAGTVLSPDDVPSAFSPSGATTTASIFERGVVVNQFVSGKLRRAHARLHSAGHLLDSAMSNLGYGFPAGRGNHFLDNPFVEYKGKIDADAKAALQTRLQEECDKLIAADAITDVVTTSKGSPGLEELGITESDLSHLSAGATVRIVRVGGSVSCPCGGTHVRRAGEIGKLTIGKLKSKKGNLQIKYSVEDLDLDGVAK